MAPSHHVFDDRITDFPIQGREVYVYPGITDCGKVDVPASYQRRLEWMASILADRAPEVWLHEYPVQESGGRTPIPAMAEQLLASRAIQDACKRLEYQSLRGKGIH